MRIISTLDRSKSEELFNRIKGLSIKINHLAAVLQNPDFVNESNSYENYCLYKENYHRIMAELSRINGSIGALHREIDNDKSHNYDLVM